MSSKTRRTVILAMLAAVAAVISAVESMIPPLPAMPPGFKVGLANIVTTYCVCSISLPAALYTVIFRSLITFAFRGAMAAALGLAGGVGAALVMWVAGRSRHVGLMGMSVLGGITHNAVQVAIAYMLIGVSALYTLPLLIPLGAVCGTVTALLLRLLTAHLNRLIEGRQTQ